MRFVWGKMSKIQTHHFHQCRDSHKQRGKNYIYIYIMVLLCIEKEERKKEIDEPSF